MKGACILCSTVCLLLLLVLIQQVSALKCYQCDSRNDPKGCGEKNFNDDEADIHKDCECCRKRVANNGTTRECVTKKHKDRCRFENNNYVCKENLCNTGNTLVVPTVVVVAALISALFQWKILG